LDPGPNGATYTAAELAQIAQIMLGGMQYKFDAVAARAFDDYLMRRMIQPHFANARSVRNALDRARLRHASRLLASNAGIVDDATLTNITEADIRASRVFVDRGETV